jgi:3-oxoacyl-[acyl-carrier protein] reductase
VRRRRDAFERAFRQHLLANHALVQAVLPGMQAARWGRIVNVISTSVKEPIAGLGVSNTIRGAVASWSKTLATELGGHGITVNNVLPVTRARSAGPDPARSARRRRATRGDHRQGHARDGAARALRRGRRTRRGHRLPVLARAGYVNGINVPVDGGRTKSL